MRGWEWRPASRFSFILSVPYLLHAPRLAPVRHRPLTTRKHTGASARYSATAPVAQLICAGDRIMKPKFYRQRSYLQLKNKRSESKK